MSTLGNDSPKGAWPPLLCNSKSECAEDLRKMYTAFTGTRDEKRVSWWKVNYEGMQRNTKDQPSYCM